jgi:hypothetical protein
MHNDSTIPSSFSLRESAITEIYRLDYNSPIPARFMGAPASTWTPGAIYSHDDVRKIATVLRCTLKTAFDIALDRESNAYGDTFRFYFGPVLDPKMTIPAFMHDFQVAGFPFLFTDYRITSEGYLRDKRGSPIFDAHLDSTGAVIVGFCHAGLLDTRFHRMADMMVKAIRAIIAMYKKWFKEEYGSDESASVPTTDQAYSGLEKLIEFSDKIPEILGHARSADQERV